MCGRFTRYLTWREIAELYSLTLDHEIGRNDEPRYNIAPTQSVPFVVRDQEGHQRLKEGRWWLVPWWAKEMPKQAMFNARVETVESSGAFKDAFKMRRCLVPADGFYEWTKGEDGGKDPWHIFLPDHAPFSFAGLWAHNDKLDVTSCTIITGPAADPMTKLHDRQPYILDPEVYEAWLDPETPPDDAKQLLHENMDGDLEFHRVSRSVNSTVVEKQRNDDASFIKPINSL